MWEVSSSIPMCDFELLFRLFSFLCSFKYLPVKQGTDGQRENGWGKVGGGVGVWHTVSLSFVSLMCTVMIYRVDIKKGPLPLLQAS